MSVMLLSIKPEYAQVILDGKKEYEFRKRRCRSDVHKIVFYATAPWSCVVGEAEIEEIIEGSPTHIWELAKTAAGITPKKYREYYHGRKTAVAYKLRNVVAYEPTRSLADYGVTQVPQSFIYIDDDLHAV